MTVYPSPAEASSTAKEDGLEVTGMYDSVYGETASPNEPMLLPEWSRSDAVLLAWFEPLQSYFETLIDAIVGVSEVWLITEDATVSEALRARFALIGIDVDRIRFFEYSHEAFWTRDFGPWSVRDATGSSVFLDPRYYPTRYRDDAVPTLLGEYFGVDVYRPRLSGEGGNIMSNGSGLCVTTSRLVYNNPPHRTYELEDVLGQWLGCIQTVFLEPLKGERTGHVDLFAKFMSADTIVVGRYDSDLDPENAARLNRM